MNQCKSVYLVISHYKSGKPDVLLKVLPTERFYYCPSWSLTPEWGYNAFRWIPPYCIETSSSNFFFISQLIIMNTCEAIGIDET